MADLKETVVKLEDNCVLHIAEDVVVSIAALAVAEVEGVAGMSGAASLADTVGKKTHNRSIRMSVEGQTVHLDIAVLVRYGYQIVQICQKVQEKVAAAIESMTGLTAGSINIHVSGVSFEKEEKKTG